MKHWIINGHDLEFDEEEHIYICDGLITPSVTQILQKKFNDYAGIPQHILEQASEKGTALHKAIEIFETTGQPSDLKEFRNYLFIKKRKGFKNIANEVPIIYEENGRVLFAGQLDQIIELNGKLEINDFKRVSAPNKEKITYQLNLYKLGYEQSYHKEIAGLNFTQLREDVRKFTPLPINEELTRKLLQEYYGG